MLNCCPPSFGRRKTHRGMFKDGVVWGLATMSRSRDVTIVRLCAVALCNLSHEFWKEIARSNSMQVSEYHEGFLATQ